MGKAISKTLDLGRNLGALRETTGETAENIQIYRRAIEETNGEASAFDAAVVRLTRSIGDAKRGSKETADVFENLGLRLSDLEKLSPAEALKVVTGRINEMQDSAAGAASKSLVLGRSYVKMGGFANMTTAEIQALTDSVSESAVVMTDEGVTSVDNFDASWRNIRDGFGKGLTLIGSFLIPLLSQLFDKMKEIAGVIKRDVVPEPSRNCGEWWGQSSSQSSRAFANVIAGTSRAVVRYPRWRNTRPSPAS